MTIKNFISHSGRAVANQYIITDGNKRTFQSYNSTICTIENGRVTLDSYYWDFSQTTGKYRNIFLGECKAETERKIKAGIYKLANLN